VIRSDHDNAVSGTGLRDCAQNMRKHGFATDPMQHFGRGRTHA
jgi:hypothetical protein